ncbi:MAG TPA: ABC transporter permease [Bryobacteraceae bacterium]|nr:ABC transporter permease [Bryobacteraceae bacterium]
MRDLRYAVRTLGRSPGFALTAVAVLALGIGANAAIFSVVHAVILKPLPFTDPGRLVFIWERPLRLIDPISARVQPARKNYLEWRRQNTVFSDVAAFREAPQSETAGDRPRHLSTGFASANFFPMLGVKAHAGRLFNADEERAGADRVAVLTDAYFESRFHRDPRALGQSLTLQGTAYTIIGTLPPKFHLPATWEGMDQRKPEIWLPLSRLWKKAEDDVSRQLLVAARLKPGVTLERARTEMTGIAARLAKADPKTNGEWSTSVYPFDVEDTAPTLRQALWVLLAAVGFLLLIACANLANLTLARATLRRREIAVRLALGATRARVVAQLAAESLLVSAAGALAGLLLAHWSIRLMLALHPPEIQRPELIGINPAVLGFAAAAGVLTTLLVGLAPAIAVSRADLNTALKSGGAWGASAARAGSRQFLIAAEVALAVTLLAGAGLMLRSFHQLLATGVGFETARLGALDIDLPESRYRDPDSQARFFRRLLERARAVPGVTGAEIVDNLPLHSVSWANFHIAGRPDPQDGSLLAADMARVSPDYLGTIGVRLRSGRFFTEADLAQTEKGKNAVAIVNQSFANKFFPNENPLGKRLLSGDKDTPSEIVGVVSDYRPMGVENGVRPQIFWPYLRIPKASLIVRAGVPPESLGKGIQAAVWSVDREIPANRYETLQSMVDEWQSQRKFNTLLLAIFAGLALTLALMGIYGVLSNLVASRVREIGIRMAIGATPAAIGRLVLIQSMTPVVLGVAAGVAGSLALSRFVEALLFQVQARDPLTLGLAAGTILVFAPAAVYAPVRRATRVECTVALCEE